MWRWSIKQVDFFPISWITDGETPVCLSLSWNSKTKPFATISRIQLLCYYFLLLLILKLDPKTSLEFFNSIAEKTKRLPQKWMQTLWKIETLLIQWRKNEGTSECLQSMPSITRQERRPAVKCASGRQKWGPGWGGLGADKSELWSWDWFEGQALCCGRFWKISAASRRAVCDSHACKRRWATQTHFGSAFLILTSSRLFPDFVSFSFLQRFSESLEVQSQTLRMSVCSVRPPRPLISRDTS